MLSRGVDVAHALPGCVQTKEGRIILVPVMDFISAQDLAIIPAFSHFISPRLFHRRTASLFHPFVLYLFFSHALYVPVFSSFLFYSSSPKTNRSSGICYTVAVVTYCSSKYFVSEDVSMS